MENNFLPPNYTVPQTQGNYMRFKQGDNKFRVMSSAIVGYEYWTTESQPVRSRLPFNETPNIKIDSNGKKQIKHFWAFVVWNYSENKISILEVTQNGIQNAIGNLVKNAEWGDPKGYDINISRSGNGLETEYLVNPSPHKEITEEIKVAFVAETINLEKLYSGGDPFEKTAPQADHTAPQSSQEYNQQKPPAQQEHEINVDNIPFG